MSFTRIGVEDPWPAGPFDVVSIVDVMHHIPVGARRAMVRTGAGILEPGGILLYKDMTDRTWRAWANRAHDLAMARQWVRYTPAAEVEAWAAEAGLALAYRADLTRLWYGHELRVFRRPAEGPAGGSTWAAPAADAEGT